MAYNVENINDALLNKKQLKEKYKGKRILFVCKIKGDTQTVFGSSLKNFVMI